MTTFDELVSESTAHPTRDISCVVLSAFGKQGTQDYTKASGRRLWDSDESLDLNSAFWCFSFTKPLTTIVALQCVERGQVSLDEDVSTILPELKNTQIIFKDANGSLKFTPAKKHITLRHLLTHTSGIGYDAMNPLLTEWRKSRGEQLLTMSGRVRDAYTLPLLFEPGESWVYGGGIDWAGIMVERLNGNIKLGEYMEAHLFKPLGMTSSTFHPESKPNIKNRLIQMTVRTESGVLEPTTCPYAADAPEDSGGMGLVSSVSDYTKVLKDLLQDKPTILKKDTIEQMFTPQFKLGSPQYKGFMAQEYLHQPLTGNQSSNLAVSFGIGGMLILGEAPNLPPNTLAWNGMTNMGWFLNREKGFGGVYASQILPSGDAKSSRLLAEFEKEMCRRFGA